MNIPPAASLDVPSVTPYAPTAKSGTPLLSTSPIFAKALPNLESSGRTIPNDLNVIVDVSNIVVPPSPRCIMNTPPSGCLMGANTGAPTASTMVPSLYTSPRDTIELPSAESYNKKSVAKLGMFLVV